MFLSNFVSVLQLIASPLFFATAAVAPALPTVALVRLFATQRGLARACRLLIKADLVERCVEPAGKPDHEGRTPYKGLKSGMEQKPGDDKKEESAGA